MKGIRTEIPGIEVAIKQGNDELYGSVKKHINFLKDTKNIIGDGLPDFARIRRYGKNVKIWELTNDMLAVISTYSYNNDVLIKLGKIEEKYKLIVYLTTYKEGSIYYAPLCFLPLLKEKSPTAHNFVVAALNCLIRTKGFATWDDWDIDCTEEYLREEIANMEEDDKNNYATKQFMYELDLYDKYGQYYRDLLFSSNHISLEELQVMYGKFTPRGIIQGKAKQFVAKIIEVCKESKDYDDFETMGIDAWKEFNETDEDEEPEGSPVTLSHVMYLGWFGAETYIENQVEGINMQAGEYGECLPGINFQCENNADLKSVKKKFLEETKSFLDKSSAMLNYGLDLYETIMPNKDNRLITILNETGELQFVQGTLGLFQGPEGK
jgi:hypothetical protein